MINLRDLVWSEKGWIVSASKGEREQKYDKWFVPKDYVKEGTAWFCKYCPENYWDSEKEIIEMILDMGYAEDEELKLLEKRIKELEGGVVDG